MKWVIIHLLISYREEAGKMKRSVISMLLAVIFSVCILPVDVWATGQYDEESDYEWYSEDDYESEPPEYNESIRNSIIHLILQKTFGHIFFIPNMVFTERFRLEIRW